MFDRTEVAACVCQDMPPGAVIEVTPGVDPELMDLVVASTTTDPDETEGRVSVSVVPAPDEVVAHEVSIVARVTACIRSRESRQAQTPTRSSQWARS